MSLVNPLAPWPGFEPRFFNGQKVGRKAAMIDKCNSMDKNSLLNVNLPICMNNICMCVCVCLCVMTVYSRSMKAKKSFTFPPSVCFDVLFSSRDHVHTIHFWEVF